MVGVRHITCVDERKTEMLAQRRHPIQLTERNIIAHPVAAVIGEPQFVCLRMPGKADRVPHAAGDGFGLPALRVDAQDRAKRVLDFTTVARRTDGYIKLAVGA